MLCATGPTSDPSQNRVLSITMTTTKSSTGFQSQSKKLRQRSPEWISDRVPLGRQAHVFHWSPGPQHQHYGILLNQCHTVLQHPVPRADSGPPRGKSSRVFIPINIPHIPDITGLYFFNEYRHEWDLGMHLIMKMGSWGTWRYYKITQENVTGTMLRKRIPYVIFLERLTIVSVEQTILVI